MRLAMEGQQSIQLFFDVHKKVVSFSEHGRTVKTVSGRQITSVVFKRKQMGITAMEMFALSTSYMGEITFQDGSFERYVWNPLWSHDALGRKTTGIDSLIQLFIDVGVPPHMVVITTRTWGNWLFWILGVGIAWFAFLY